MCLAQGPQRSDAGEAPTRDPSVSSQALYHWATALPLQQYFFSMKTDNMYFVKYSIKNLASITSKIQ